MLHVQKLIDNLLSVPNLVQKGSTVILKRESAFIYAKNGPLIFKGKFSENVFSIILSKNKNKRKHEDCFQVTENVREIRH